MNMETVAGQTDTLHAVAVLSSLNKLRQEEFVCDFAIKVGDCTYAVHRVVLVACSDYFKAMFSYDMKEKQQGFVEMKDLESEAIKQCIEFMYTGKAVINNANIQWVLQAAYVMLLDNLVKLCYQQLNDSINEKNCFLTKEIARIFSNENLTRMASKFIIDNFKDVILSKGFRKLAKEEVFGYLSSYDKDHEVTWKAIVLWIKHDVKTRKMDLYELMTYAHVGKFPPEYLLGTVWQNPMVGENSKIKDWIVACVFSGVENLQSGITFENCFLLKKLAKIYYHDNSKTVEGVVDSFIMHFLEKIVELEEFLKLDAAIVEMYLECTNYASEIKKWEAAVKWTRYNVEKRRTLFPKLFRSINFDEMTVDFIENVVRAESLVNESDECKEIVTNAFSTKLRNLGPTRYLLALCKGPGQVVAPQISEDTKFSRIVNVRNELYLLVDASLYQMKRKIWVEREGMKQKPEETAQVVAFQNSIYVVENNKLSKYDPKESMWNKDLSPCDIRWIVTATATADHIYAFGRAEEDRITPKMKRFNHHKDIWENIAVPAEQYDSGTTKYASAVLDGMVYVIGTYCRNRNISNSGVWRYEPFGDTWTKMEQMTRAKSNFCAFGTGGSLYVIGGEEQSRTGATTIGVYNGQNNEWRLLSGTISHPVSACDLIKW